MTRPARTRKSILFNQRISILGHFTVKKANMLLESLQIILSLDNTSSQLVHGIPGMLCFTSIAFSFTDLSLEAVVYFSHAG